MKKVMKVILIILVVIALLLVTGCTVLSRISDYKNKYYYKYATPGGDIEAKYTPLDSYDVSYAEFDAESDIWKKYEVYYPTEMNITDNKYPMIIMANGTGIAASKYSEVFEHLASWGFIVVGNEDENSRTGASSAATLDFMLKLSQDETSDFFCKIDTDNIGIAGHSQGGVGAINAVSAQENGTYYKAMFTASTASSYWGQEQALGVEWSYDTSKINIPIFMVAGTGYFDQGEAADISETEGQGICPLWDLIDNYNKIPDTTPKLIARAVDKDHGDMLRAGDAYMTAWFMYWLKGDAEAGKAFFGNEAELLSNPNWQDILINSTEK